MNEIKKLEEAKYFYSKMIDEQQNKGVFIHNLSAFLSSARSILQYAKKEAKNKSSIEGQKWYDDIMATSPILKFFKDERDGNIHTEPVLPKAHYKLHAEGGIYMIGTLSVIVFDKDGNIKQELSEANLNTKQEKPNQRSKSIPNEVKYVFEKWTGNEDVLTLSKMYIQELESTIQDGIARGFIAK